MVQGRQVKKLTYRGAPPKKVSLARIFYESTLYSLEINALEEDPIDGD